MCSGSLHFYSSFSSVNSALVIFCLRLNCYCKVVKMQVVQDLQSYFSSFQHPRIGGPGLVGCSELSDGCIE